MMVLLRPAAVAAAAAGGPVDSEDFVYHGL